MFKLVFRSTLAALGACTFVTPAQADDWQSVCSFDAADLSLIVNYHAGDPSYDILVTLSGKTELGRGRKIPMNVLQTEKDTVLFSKWDEDMQVVLRVAKDDTAIATIEIGNGVSWDYQSFRGSCKSL